MGIMAFGIDKSARYIGYLITLGNLIGYVIGKNASQ